MRAVTRAMCLALACAASVQAAVITVDTTADDLTNNGNCTLREAIRSANANGAFDACVAGNDPDEIIVPAGVYLLDLTGSLEEFAATGDLDIRDGVTITGDGRGVTIIDGNDTDRVFDVDTAEAVLLRDLTVRNGVATGDFGGAVLAKMASNLQLEDCAVESSNASAGAGVYHAGGLTSSLTITRCTVSGNVATTDGGGVYAYQAPTVITDTTIDDNDATQMGGGLAAAGGSVSFTVSVQRSTISNNDAGNAGGGVVAANFATVILTNTTLSGNSAVNTAGALMHTFSDGVHLRNVTITNNETTAGDAGGIVRGSGTAGITMRNSIVAGNTSTGANPDCFGAITSEGYNLVGTVGASCSISGTTTGNLTGPADLGSLADNGGPTLTHQLLAGSDAIDAGDPATPGSGGTTCETIDQRGYTRPGEAFCDMGAVESDATPPTTTTTSTTTTSSTTITSTTTTSTTSTSTTSTSAITTTTSVSTTTSTAPGSSSTTTTTPTSTTLGPPPSSSTTLPPPPPPPCISPAPPGDSKLTMQKIGGVTGDEKLAFRGSVLLPAGNPPSLDPSTQGMQLVFEQPGTPPTAYMRLVAATGPVPPGGPGTGCDPKDGWKGLTYVNKSGALPPTCAPGSAQGLRSVKLKDKRAKGRGIFVTVKAVGATIPPPTGTDVRVVIVFGASSEAGAAGRCTAVELDCTTKKSKVTCGG